MNTLEAIGKINDSPKWRAKVGRDGRVRVIRAGYEGAATDRLFSDWTTSNLSADEEIKGSFSRLRDRARDLERNNDYVRRWLNILENNVVGANGMKFQSRVVEENSKQMPDEMANRAIEKAFTKWSKPRYASANERLSFSDIQHSAIRRVSVDGELLIRKLTPKQSDNPFGFTLQPLEGDHIDHELNKDLGNGNFISMGIEQDSFGKHIAYHVYSTHPGANVLNYKRKTRQRLSAENFYLLMRPDRPGQARGITQSASVMSRLKMLAGYEEASLVHARAGACQMGFLKKVLGEGPPLGSDDSPFGDTDGPYYDAEPGTIKGLPPGYELQNFNPNEPHTAFSEYVKAVLRAIAAGLGISYFTLANDLEGVNYTSSRTGLLEDREQYKKLQTWLILSLCMPVFEDWLTQSLLMGAVTIDNGKPLPFSKFDKFNKPFFQGRRWQWVDPLKEVMAINKALENNLTSKRRVMAEQGNDIEEIYQEISADDDLAEKYLNSEEEAEQEKSDTVLKDDLNIAQNIKQQADAYGVAVRAGSITPQKEDETAFRKKFNLPTMGKEVEQAWEDDGGARRPITLKPQDVFEAEGVDKSKNNNANSNQEEDSDE